MYISYFIYKYIYVTMRARCPEARRRCQTPWNWSYRCLSSAMWVLEIKPRTSSRAARALNNRAISPTLFSSIFN